MQDFLQALQLDPDNAELTKLLTTAREKYLEVEGISAVVEEEEEEDDAEDVEVQEVSAPAHVGKKMVGMAEALAVAHTQGSEGLLLPPVGAALLKVGSLLSVAASTTDRQLHQPSSSSSCNSNSFVRINVVSDDEEEEDEDEEEEIHTTTTTTATTATTAAAATNTFSRIAITDEEESDEEEGEDKASSQAIEVKAATLKEKGNELLKRGDAAGAVDAYTQSLNLLPTYLPSLNNRAQAHLILKVNL